MKDTLKGVLDAVVFAVVSVVLVLSCGCTRTIYTPIETRVETNTNVADSTQTERIGKLIDQLQNSVRTHEKVIIRDSVVYVVNEQGEVKSKEIYHSGDRDYSEREAVTRITQIYDSLFHRQLQRVDSVLNTFRQEPVIVETEPSLWSKIKTGLTVGVIGWLAIGALVGIFFLYRKIKSKYFH